MEEDENLEEITESEYMLMMKDTINLRINSLKQFNNKYKQAYEQYNSEIEQLYSIIDDIQLYKKDYKIKFYKGTEGLIYQPIKKKAIGFET